MVLNNKNSINDNNTKIVSESKRLSEKLGLPVNLVVASILASASPVMADENNSFDFDSNVSSVKSKSYSDFVNVYWVDKKYSKWNSYAWAWIKVHTDNFEAVAEDGKDYYKVWATWVLRSENGLYWKVWASYLKLNDFKVGEYSIDPSQFTYGWAIWYWNEKLNIEWGYINHKLTWAYGADTTANTKYVEWIYREDTRFWQFDLTWLYKQEEAYWIKDNNYWWNIAYYPTQDIKASYWYDSGIHVRDTYSIKAGLKYTFGWEKEWKFSPFISWNYNTTEHSYATLSYEQEIANRPLHWKDEFENTVLSVKQIVAQKVAPKVFEEKVKESFNKLPTVTISASSTTITVWDSVSLTATASDSDGIISSIVWYDGNNNQIWTWASVSVTPNAVWTYSYYSKVTDNDGAVTTSNTQTITVNEVPNTAPTLNLSMSWTNFIDNWWDNYRSETWGSVTFDLGWSSDSDWNVARYVVKNTTTWEVLYDGSNSSYTMSTSWKTYNSTENFETIIYDNDWASSSKNISIIYDI